MNLHISEEKRPQFWNETLEQCFFN